MKTFILIVLVILTFQVWGDTIQLPPLHEDEPELVEWRATMIERLLVHLEDCIDDLDGPEEIKEEIKCIYFCLDYFLGSPSEFDEDFVPILAD